MSENARVIAKIAEEINAEIAKIAEISKVMAALPAGENGGTSSVWFTLQGVRDQCGEILGRRMVDLIKHGGTLTIPL